MRGFCVIKMLTAFTGVALLILLAEFCLLAHDGVWFYRYILTFRRKSLLAQFCTFKIQTAGYTETFGIYMTNYTASRPQKTVIFTDTAFRVLIFESLLVT